jgi:hypothetical protein
MKVINSKNEPLILLGLLFVMCDVLLLARVAYIPTALFDCFLSFLVSPALLWSIVFKSKVDWRKTSWFLVADVVLWFVNFKLLTARVVFWGGYIISNGTIYR